MHSLGSGVALDAPRSHGSAILKLAAFPDIIGAHAWQTRKIEFSKTLGVRF